jgi:small subunit ribosomal protein S21
MARPQASSRQRNTDLLHPRQFSGRLARLRRFFVLFHSDRTTTDAKHVQVIVRDNNVDQALKVLKKKMQREGIFREMKLRGHYEKPSERRARQKAEAIRRARKLARKRAQREGGTATALRA